MSLTPRQPEPLENRVANLERNMTDLPTAAEALLQTAQIHQQNFEAVGAELQISRAELQASRTELQASRTELQTLRQRHIESDQRFEIMLAEFRQLKIESDARFNGLQTEIRRVIDRLFNQPNSDDLSS